MSAKGKAGSLIKIISLKKIIIPNNNNNNIFLFTIGLLLVTKNMIILDLYFIFYQDHQNQCDY